MRGRTKLLAVAVVATALGAISLQALSAQAATVCTWAGTPAEPTGTFTVRPGLTATPSAEPAKLRATGPIGGGPGCSGRMTFVGEFHAGSTCELATFDGKVKGLPGVARFFGAGNVIAPSVLYDRAGNAVGSEQPQLVTGTGSGSELSDCLTPEGFTHGSFSSVLELF
jgi:hypothetical protein